VELERFELNLHAAARQHGALPGKLYSIDIVEISLSLSVSIYLMYKEEEIGSWSDSNRTAARRHGSLPGKLSSLYLDTVLSISVSIYVTCITK